ncbi:MAG: PAS domain S-box protein [Desulfobacteraceae bacterium]|nr:PAS domain S-box protein [Desulfobacteraceae bacterium]
MYRTQSHPLRMEALLRENRRLKAALFSGRGSVREPFRIMPLNRRRGQKSHEEKGAGIAHRLDTMKLVFSAIQDMVLITDHNGRVLVANPATTESVGYDPTGMNIEQVVSSWKLRHEDGSDATGQNSPLTRSLAGETIFNNEYRITDGAGSKRLISLCAAPIASNRSIIGGVAVIHDKTERDAILQRVQLKRAALQAVIDHAPEGIVVVDRQGMITMTNPAAEVLYGRPLPNGLSLEAHARMGLRQPDGRCMSFRDLPLSRSVFDGATISDVRILVDRPGGKSRIISANTSPIRDDLGQINGAVGIYRDVTEQHIHHNQLSADRDELRGQVNERNMELQAMVRELEAQIAERRRVEKKLIQSKKKLQRLSRHTLNTLENNRKKMAKELHDGIGASLSAIKFIVEEKQAMIEKRYPDADFSLQSIIRHLTDTIKETKSISAYLRPSTLDDLGLRSTLSWYCREFSAIRRGIQVDCRIDVAESEIPEEYKIVLYRIIQEAMINAAKHADPTIIRCLIDRRGDQIHLTVQDNGHGFNPVAALASNDPMSGYGLQSMRERAEICGGIFKINSQVGLGTQIKVCLPLRSKDLNPE